MVTDNPAAFSLKRFERVAGFLLIFDNRVAPILGVLCRSVRERPLLRLAVLGEIAVKCGARSHVFPVKIALRLADLQGVLLIGLRRLGVYRPLPGWGPFMARVGLACAATGEAMREEPYSATWYAVFLLATLLPTAAVYWGLERPVARLRRRLRH